MDPRYSYAHEKFTAARDILAEGASSQRERLRAAYLGQGNRGSMSMKRGSGDALIDRILDFHERMTAEPAKADEGTINATIDAMSDDEVDDAVRELVGIAGALELANWP